MSIFAPDAFPQWLRVFLFWLGVAMLLIGFAAATYHYRPKGWLHRHVWWRFGLSPPRTQVAAKLKPAATTPEALNSTVPPGPSRMDQLFAKRELLTTEVEQMERSIAPCADAVERYRQGVAKLLKERVNRPVYDPLWPERTLQSAVNAFTSHRLKDAAWSAGLNDPKPNLEQSPPTPHSLTSNRQYFDPAHNQRYLGLHRENLIYMDEALEEAKQRMQELRNQLSQVQTEIQNEARQIHG